MSRKARLRALLTELVQLREEDDCLLRQICAKEREAQAVIEELGIALQPGYRQGFKVGNRTVIAEQPLNVLFFRIRAS